MSDQDSRNEDRFIAKEECEASAKVDSIQFHADNWINAVTKSPAQSHGTFKDVTERGWIGFERTETVRPATSVDVLLEQLDNADYAQRAAQILIDFHGGKSFTQAAIEKLFKDMADSYAEFQYESNIKE
jgi:creatinine amidohydrolase/Fe(II)-dependent formamide hydrolase-like protein